MPQNSQISSSKVQVFEERFLRKPETSSLDQNMFQRSPGLSYFLFFFNLSSVTFLDEKKSENAFVKIFIHLHV